MKRAQPYYNDDEEDQEVTDYSGNEKRAHHCTPDDVESGSTVALGASALNPANSGGLTKEEQTLASDAMADRPLTEEEEEELRDLFRNGTIKPGDDVYDDWHGSE
jgi:hypothetical protein